MELFFNEISGCYKASNLFEAKARMRNFLDLCKRAKLEGFELIRTNREFDHQELSDGYKVWDWYSDPGISRSLKDFFLGYRKHPYETGDEVSENLFMEATYKLHEPDEKEYHGAVVEGLAWAFIKESLCISFPVNDVWKKTNIGLLEENGLRHSYVFAYHASQLDHIALHRDWISSLKEFFLVESDLSPAEKRIQLRDDHGKDTLTEFSQKLIKSPYIEGVLNSLPFNPQARSFIRKTYPDGKIEFVLLWTDEGLGVVVQSTGRNQRETDAIAKILKDKYASLY